MGKKLQKYPKAFQSRYSEVLALGYQANVEFRLDKTKLYLMADCKVDKVCHYV